MASSIFFRVLQRIASPIQAQRVADKPTGPHYIKAKTVRDHHCTHGAACELSAHPTPTCSRPSTTSITSLFAYIKAIIRAEGPIPPTLAEELEDLLDTIDAEFDLEPVRGSTLLDTDEAMPSFTWLDSAPSPYPTAEPIRPVEYSPFRISLLPDLDGLFPLGGSPLRDMRAVAARIAFLSRLVAHRSAVAAHCARLLDATPLPLLVAAELRYVLHSWEFALTDLEPLAADHLLLYNKLCVAAGLPAPAPAESDARSDYGSEYCSVLSDSTYESDNTDPKADEKWSRRARLASWRIRRAIAAGRRDAARVSPAVVAAAVGSPFEDGRRRLVCEFHDVRITAPPAAEMETAEHLLCAVGNPYWTDMRVGWEGGWWGLSTCECERADAVTLFGACASC